MIYLLLLLIGGIGFLAMFLLGFAHFGGGHGHGGAHIGGHHVGGHHAGGHGHAQGGAHSGAADSFMSIAKSWLSFSPMDLFGACLGAGAAGLLFERSVSGSILPWLAVAGALIICLLIMRPLTTLLERFVSTPSEGLESMVAKPAEAVSNFDHKGQGLIRVHLDGQLIQRLGLLDITELEAGVTVKKGDALTIVEVDAKRNMCKVSRELSA